MRLEDANRCSPFEYNLIMVLERIAEALEHLVQNDDSRI